MTTLYQPIYFTIGEFAELFNISKQTLFYYERNDIFAPEHTADNGYRYYSLRQYFIFEIIITLRKLNIPLKTIKEYVNNRSLKTLTGLFEDKIIDYDIQIGILERNKQNLESRLARLKSLARMELDKPFLNECATEYMVVDELPDKRSSMKKHIKAVAAHRLPFTTDEIINEYLAGYILSRDKLLSGDFKSPSTIYTRVTHPDEYPHSVPRAAGTYLTIRLKDAYHATHMLGLRMLLDYVQTNNLRIIGDAYIQKLRNYWSSPNHQDYITQIEIPVEKI